MARLQRKELADLRAMEEEDARVTMRGRGKQFVGAGATPSMGLSQFRGGAKGRKGRKKRHESESDEEYEGGAGLPLGALSGVVSRAARFKPSTALIPYRSAANALVPFNAASRAIVPYSRGVSSAVSRLPSTSSTALITSRFSKPSLPMGAYAGLYRRSPMLLLDDAARAAPRALDDVVVPSAPRVTDDVVAAASKTAARTGTRLSAATIAKAAAMGIPLAALMGVSIAGMAGADPFGLNEYGTSGDAGYYDDYAGDGAGGDMGDGGLGTVDAINTDGFAGPSIGGPNGPNAGGVPSDLSPNELAWYLQSGNLPERYAYRQKRSRVRGMGKIGGAKRDGRTERAAIVRQVMHERGVKLAEASRIVKAEGLY